MLNLGKTLKLERQSNYVLKTAKLIFVKSKHKNPHCVWFGSTTSPFGYLLVTFLFCHENLPSLNPCETKKNYMLFAV